jgi:MSHA pilin protein MshA
MNNHVRGFTLIELIIVIVILGVLSVVAAPRFIDLSRDARIAGLESLAGQMNSTIDLVQAKARVSGLRPTTTNPGGVQSDYIVEFPFGSVEIDFRNLCPESEGEGGDQLDFPDFLELSGEFNEDSNKPTSNQYTGIGYDVPSGFPTDSGCYVRYDSFGTPDCTVEVIDDDC